MSQPVLCAYLITDRDRPRVRTEQGFLNMSTRSSDPLAFRAVHWQVGEGTPFGVLSRLTSPISGSEPLFFFFLHPHATKYKADDDDVPYPPIGAPMRNLLGSRPEPLADSLIFRTLRSGGLGGGSFGFSVRSATGLRTRYHTTEGNGSPNSIESREPTELETYAIFFPFSLCLLLPPGSTTWMRVSLKHSNFAFRYGESGHFIYRDLTTSDRCLVRNKIPRVV